MSVVLISGLKNIIRELKIEIKRKNKSKKVCLYSFLF